MSLIGMTEFEFEVKVLSLNLFPRLSVSVLFLNDAGFPDWAEGRYGNA